MPNFVNARSGGIVKTRGSPVLFYTLSFHCFLKSAFFLESKKTKAYQGHPKPDKDSYNPLLFSYELDEKHSIIVDSPKMSYQFNLYARKSPPQIYRSISKA
jgi:hypothetical protein